MDIKSLEIFIELIDWRINFLKESLKTSQSDPIKTFGINSRIEEQQGTKTALEKILNDLQIK